MMFNTEINPQLVTIEGQTFERMEEYKYLGQVIMTRREQMKDIQHLGVITNVTTS